MSNGLHPSFCKFYLTNGCKFGQGCSRRHDIFMCTCGQVLLEENRGAHTQGKRHREQLAALLGASDASSVNGHGSRKKRERHRKATSTGTAAAAQPAPAEPAITSVTCEECHKSVISSEFDAHLAVHAAKQRVDELKTELDAAKDDKNGVTVTGRSGIHFGILDVGMSVEFAITVTSNEANVSLKSCRMASAARDDEPASRFSARLRGKSKMVQKGGIREVAVLFKPAFEGTFEDTLQLVFYDLDRRNTFVISRSLEAVVGSREDHEHLKASAPYKRRRYTKFNPHGTIIPSLRPPDWTKTAWKDKLPPYTAPRPIIDAVYANGGRTAHATVKRLMPAAFNLQSYGAWFQTLLWLEEERVKVDLDAYSLMDVELESKHPRYNLLVEGLAENRPSVLVGDFILVSHPEPADAVNTRTWYEGRVHQVYQNHVSLRFGDQFSMYQGSRFDVRFVLNRLSYRRMHHALVNKNDPSRFLFPTMKHVQGFKKRLIPERVYDIHPFNRPVGNDYEQMEVVAAILNMEPGSVPFVVFGPPGTGKTVTIIEAMLQLLHKDPNVRILACAPNNSAADTLAFRLKHLGRTEVFRLNSLSRPVTDMPKSLREFSQINENQVFAMPTLESVSKFRVVVSTCLSAGVPANLGLKRGHFTHIFIDEAGQGKEPEIMVPIKSSADDKTNLILAGDNQQLGPVIHSPLAGALGLRTSYLSRVMDQDVYSLDNWRGITIVKLIKNFRSHPAILQFSNENFYKSELQPCGDHALTHSLERFEELPKKQFPVIFHSIVGKDQREASSPSFFNIDEATVVKKYCLSLLSNRKNNLRGEDIGVITPYHAQRCKILSLLQKDLKLREIKVGSVEEFQGQERRVIIMSTVRSNKDFITADIRRSLGFVANKRRLNVALTRAQALLIVIGNPIVLSLDPLWRAFLNYVYRRGGWKGKQIDWDPSENDDVFGGGAEGDGAYAAYAAAYAEERRNRAQGDMEDEVARIRALIMETHDRLDVDVESEEDVDAAAFERPILREAE